jgi:hypothetical protein
VRESRQVIKELSVGAAVTAHISGGDRFGMLTWIGITKVEISYRLKSGAERSRCLYARDVVLVSPELVIACDR